MTLQRWMPFGRSCWRILREVCSKIEQEETPNSRTIWGGEIILKAGAILVKQRMFQIQGERRAAWVKLTDEIFWDDKIEPGISPWSSPSFPVPKKKLNDYR